MFKILGLESITQWANKLLLDTDIISNIENDEGFMQSLRIIIAENFNQVWDSQGSIIGENWDGRDLIQTGNLKSSLTQPARIRITRVGNLFFISSDVIYAEEVNNKFNYFGITEETKQKINNLLNNYLVMRGNLDWRIN